MSFAHPESVGRNLRAAFFLILQCFFLRQIDPPLLIGVNDNYNLRLASTRDGKRRFFVLKLDQCGVKTSENNFRQIFQPNTFSLIRVSALLLPFVFMWGSSTDDRLSFPVLVRCVRFLEDCSELNPPSIGFAPAVRAERQDYSSFARYCASFSRRS